ncbi:hypothetical protein ACO2Q1_16920 [Brevundimonas sp. VNH65]|uniref:hypothetical protein n=1 Tax=Brevundimonas sp. VNH65 TaxID=3400917 RepID=UPI003C08AEBC
MTYEIDYTGTQPRQTGGPPGPPVSLPPIQTFHPEPRFRVPGVLKTGATLVVAAGIFFGVETFAPYQYKPSTLVGSYDARIEAEVKAAQLQQQAAYDDWLEEVRLVNAQNLESYRASNQAALGYYQASYDRARVYAEATARMQGDLANAQIRLASQTRGGERGLANASRTLGQVINLFAPGSGDAAIQYGNDLADMLTNDLNRAAQSGAPISIEGWDANLPPPNTVQAELSRIVPLPLPEPPRLSDDRPMVPEQ